MCRMCDPIEMSRGTSMHKQGRAGKFRGPVRNFEMGPILLV
jgi:hypothetical protein